MGAVSSVLRVHLRQSLTQSLRAGQVAPLPLCGPVHMLSTRASALAPAERYSGTPTPQAGQWRRSEAPYFFAFQGSSRPGRSLLLPAQRSQVLWASAVAHGAICYHERPAKLSDHERMTSPFVRLERRTGLGGKGRPTHGRIAAPASRPSRGGVVRAVETLRMPNFCLAAAERQGDITRDQGRSSTG